MRVFIKILLCMSKHLHNKKLLPRLYNFVVADVSFSAETLPVYTKHII